MEEHLTEEELFNAVIQLEETEMEEQEQEEQPKPSIVQSDIGDKDVHLTFDLRNLLHAGKCLEVYDNIMAVVSDQCILNTQCKKILTLPMIPDYDHLVVTVSRKFSVTETVLKGFLQDLKTNPSQDVERYLERVPQAARNFYREIMLEYFKALQRMRAHGTRDFSEANTVKLENLGRGWKGAISKACREAGSSEPTFVIRLIGLIVAEAQEIVAGELLHPAIFWPQDRRRLLHLCTASDNLRRAVCCLQPQPQRRQLSTKPSAAAPTQIKRNVAAEIASVGKAIYETGWDASTPIEKPKTEHISHSSSDSSSPPAPLGTKTQDEQRKELKIKAKV